jgi:hypothetical protein
MQEIYLINYGDFVYLKVSFAKVGRGEAVKQESILLSINVNFVKTPFAKLGTVQSNSGL